jgi:hypothetical protein
MDYLLARAQREARKEQCPDCDGTGEELSGLGRCETCKPLKGHVNIVTCPYCSGRGWKNSKEQLEELYGEAPNEWSECDACEARGLLRVWNCSCDNGEVFYGKGSGVCGVCQGRGGFSEPWCPGGRPSRKPRPERQPGSSERARHEFLRELGLNPAEVDRPDVFTSLDDLINQSPGESVPRGTADPGTCGVCTGSGKCGLCNGSGWSREPDSVSGSSGSGCRLCSEADWPGDRRGTGQCLLCSGTGRR